MQTTQGLGPQAPAPLRQGSFKQRRKPATIEQRHYVPKRAEVPASKVPPKAPAMTAVNPFVRLLLRSPLHVMLSNTLLLLTYTGRTSGRRYTIPVAYSRVGEVINVFTLHAWWKNLRCGAPVVVEIKRQRFAGAAEAISDDQKVVAEALLEHVCDHPSMARIYHIPLDANGQPDPHATWQIAPFVVLVRIRLAPLSGEVPYARA
jgi:hypothetical protein